MLKAKKSQLDGKNKSAAYKEVKKKDKTKRLYALVPQEDYFKLKRMLVDRDISYTDWLIDTIKKI